MHSNILVKRLAVVFGEPKTEDPEGFLFEYANATKGTPKDILNAATDVIIKQRKFRAWPTVAECLEAIDAAKKQTVAKGKMLEPIGDFPSWYQSRLDRIEAATTREDMHAILDEIRPYDAAGWIAPHRIAVAVKAVERRCQRLFGAEASELTNRITGERE